MTVDPKAAAARYRRALLEDVIPFWERRSIDREHGGFLTCLDREGRVYDTDKFTWLQGRQVWTFAMLYNRVERRKAWLDTALHGADFLERHGRDPAGRWHFSLDRQGRPLTQAYSLFSDCFAAMAFSQLFAAGGEARHREIAASTWRGILARRDDPKKGFSKAVPGARPLKPLAVPMILLNLSFEMEPVIGPEEALAVARASADEILRDFLDPHLKVLHEHVAPDGAKVDCFEGRLVNPGHGIEACWFLMDLARRTKDAALAAKAREVLLSLLDLGWDARHGGILYLLDAMGKPPQQLEWDQKLWWVHAEALVAAAMAWADTGDAAFRDWFAKLDDYAWKRFPDPTHGEWLGYLDRRGEPLLTLKGGKWKGCFHVPRALLLCSRELEKV